MIDLDELERLAKAHLKNFHADSMPPMKIDAAVILVLVACIRELESICGEAYQVVGVLAEEAGRFDDPQSVKVMDNLSQQKMVHDDVLPFPAKGG